MRRKLLTNQHGPAGVSGRVKFYSLSQKLFAPVPLKSPIIFCARAAQIGSVAFNSLAEPNLAIVTVLRKARSLNIKEGSGGRGGDERCVDVHSVKKNLARSPASAAASSSGGSAVFYKRVAALQLTLKEPCRARGRSGCSSKTPLEVTWGRMMSVNAT
ncbi:hypothetical protein MRX96_012615 [Rhipicephalus microplus]